MAKFDKLTGGELRRLIALARQTKQAKIVVDDDIYWTFVPVLDGSYIRAEGEGTINSALAARGQQPLERMQVDALHVKRWAEGGYVSLLSGPKGFSRFLFTPRGEDYLVYRGRRRPIRWFVGDIVKCCGREPPRRRIPLGYERISYHRMALTGTSRPGRPGT